MSSDDEEFFSLAKEGMENGEDKKTSPTLEQPREVSNSQQKVRVYVDGIEVDWESIDSVFYLLGKQSVRFGALEI